jgi:DNA-binding SARP family transcriptional activator
VAGWRRPSGPSVRKSQALYNLRRNLAHLRQALGAAGRRLHAPSPRSLALDLEGVAVDLIAFDAAVARGDLASVEQAVALYRGPLLEGCAEEWVTAERHAREQACLEALGRLAEADRARGDHAGAVGRLRRAVAIDPLCEERQRRWGSPARARSSIWRRSASRPR